MNQSVELGQDYTSSACLALTREPGSLGNQDVSILASGRATKEGGSGGGIKMEGCKPPRPEHSQPQWCSQFSHQHLLPQALPLWPSC